MKRCTQPDHEYRNGRCETCHKVVKQRYSARPDVIARRTLQSSAGNAKRFGGMPILATLAEVMQVQQAKACAICGCTNKRLETDHDHCTGKLRGMLCHGCNRMALDAEKIRKVLAYVERYQ